MLRHILVHEKLLELTQWSLTVTNSDQKVEEQPTAKTISKVGQSTTFHSWMRILFGPAAFVITQSLDLLSTDVRPHGKNLGVIFALWNLTNRSAQWKMYSDTVCLLAHSCPRSYCGSLYFHMNQLLVIVQMWKRHHITQMLASLHLFQILKIYCLSSHLCMFSENFPHSKVQSPTAPLNPSDPPTRAFTITILRIQ